MNTKVILSAVSLLLASGIACAADQAAFDKAMAEAKEAVQVAAAAKGEWRDTGKMLKEAEKAAAAGDYAKAVKLAEAAKMEGILGAQQANGQANVGNPGYLY